MGVSFRLVTNLFPRLPVQGRRLYPICFLRYFGALQCHYAFFLYYEDRNMLVIDFHLLPIIVSSKKKLILISKNLTIYYNLSTITTSILPIYEFFFFSFFNVLMVSCRIVVPIPCFGKFTVDMRTKLNEPNRGCSLYPDTYKRSPI